jgi:hypothetical protein
MALDLGVGIASTPEHHKKWRLFLFAVNLNTLFTSDPVDGRDQNPPTDRTVFGMRRSKIMK